MAGDSGDHFGDAEAYEAYVGRWSRLVAGPFIEWLAVPAGNAWLDVGAGTGVLTSVILEVAAPARVVGIDLSPAYLALARQRIRDSRAEFVVGDAAGLAIHPPRFDVAVAGLLLNFVPAPGSAVQAMARAVRSGGLAAAYVWDYGAGMQMMRHFWKAAAELDPAASTAEAAQQYALCQPDRLSALFESAGLVAVETRPIDIETRFSDFDDYWLPFLGAQGSVAAYFHGLSDGARAALRDRLRARLPVMPDGSIPLTARAWAVKGQVEAG